MARRFAVILQLMLLLAAQASAGIPTTTTTVPPTTLPPTTTTTTVPPTTLPPTTTTTTVPPTTLAPTTTSTTTTTTSTTTTLPMFTATVPHINRGTFNSNNLFARDRIEPFGLEQGWTTYDLTGFSSAMFSSAKLSWTSSWDDNWRDHHGMNIYVFADPDQQTPDEAGHIVHTPLEGCYGPGNENHPQFDENCPTHTAFLFGSETEANDAGEVMGCDYLNELTCSPIQDVTSRIKALLDAGESRIVVMFFSHNPFWRIRLEPLPTLELYASSQLTTTTTTTTTTSTTTTTTLPPVTTTLPSGSTTTTTTTLPNLPVCGDPAGNENVVHRASTWLSATSPGDGSRTVTATDALFVLQAAVGSSTCELCICDVDSSGSVAASDALAVLKFAVGQEITLSCPSCAAVDR